MEGENWEGAVGIQTGVLRIKDGLLVSMPGIMANPAGEQKV